VTYSRQDEGVTADFLDHSTYGSLAMRPVSLLALLVYIYPEVLENATRGRVS
jgi:hypothetical protein